MGGEVKRSLFGRLWRAFLLSAVTFSATVSLLLALDGQWDMAAMNVAAVALVVLAYAPSPWDNGTKGNG